MKNEYVSVNIKWFNSSISYSEIPPKGIRFCPQIKFEEEGDGIPRWTAEVIIKKWGSGSSCYAELRYLFEHGPSYLLRQGKKFILFDGPNEIAEGEVLGDL